MARSPRSLYPILLWSSFIAIVAGCAEQPDQVVTPNLAVQGAASSSGTSSEVRGRELRQAGDRKDTEWQRMAAHE